MSRDRISSLYYINATMTIKTKKLALIALNYFDYEKIAFSYNDHRKIVFNWNVYKKYKKSNHYENKIKKRLKKKLKDF